MKQGTVKQLRDFIKSHEMRYFVEHNDYNGQTLIKKAFKVEIENNAEYWVYFLCGNRPEIKDERILLKTMEEAKAKAQKMREAYQKQKKEKAAARKAKFEEVTRYLKNFNMWSITEWDDHDKVVKTEGRDFVKAIKDLYAQTPDKEKDDKQTYINLLQRYIRYGTIYTQALAFRKEHVVSVKYGEDGAVKVELINGTTIIPKSESVTNLIKTIFGDRLDSWSYDDVKKPTDKLDKIDKHKW